MRSLTLCRTWPNFLAIVQFATFATRLPQMNCFIPRL